MKDEGSELPNLGNLSLNEGKTNISDELTQAQAVGFQKEIMVELAIILIASLFIWVGTIVTAPISIEFIRLHQNVFNFFVTLLFVCHVIYIILKFRREFLAIEQRKVKIATGNISIKSVLNASPAYRSLHLDIAGKTFVISEKQSGQLSSGKLYRVYFAELLMSNRLISIERVER